MWLWECSTPHPPIIIPEVGRGRETEASQTLRGMEGLRSAVHGNTPDVLLVLSPHAPYGRGLVITLASQYRGNFASFGLPLPVLSIAGAPDRGERLAAFLFEKFPGSVTKKNMVSLDHGALVPLVSLYGWEGTKIPAVILANPIGLTAREALSLGEALTRYDDLALWGLLASGDLSHRVTPDSPNGYSPLGTPFDAKIARALSTNEGHPLLEISDDEIDEVGQCGLNSALVYLGLGGKRRGRLLSYEAPFGVGYAVAFTPLHGAPEVARAAVAKATGTDQAGELPAEAPELAKQAACFVTLKKHGELRGCIGTILPRHRTLADEIRENAVAAATEDPRFPPVRPEELPDLEISVDILSEPEQVSGPEQLDPKRYGVIVEQGGRRGVLLPDLDGVHTVQDQLSIAARKAGIRSLDGSTVSRFTVRRIREVPLP